MKHTLITLIAFSLVLACAIVGLDKPASALSGADWRAGHIIDVNIFRNQSSMSVQDIQNFLNAKVPSCDTWGTKPSEYGGGTRAQYGTSRGSPPPYTCLKDYSQNGRSSAQIIYDYAQQYKINPQTLLVLLQKEQTLITDDWPWPIQYRSATGYGCPDNAPCDSQYYGLENQVRWAARMYQAISDNDPDWYSPYLPGNNFIQWNPQSSCGGSNVQIDARATAALYSYTPYQPNATALSNIYGSQSDGCSSYGNRNFWRLFNDWFGRTVGDWVNNDDGDELINGPDLCRNVSGSSLHNGCQINSTTESNTVSGDFNGDGYGDVLAFSVFPDGKTFNILLFPGTSSGLGSPVLQKTLGPSMGGWVYQNAKPTVTDVNNDNYDDLVIFHRGPNNEIVRHVLKGSASGLQDSDPSMVTWQFPGDGWQWTNLRVVGGGDFNGDGYGDIAVFLVSQDGYSFSSWIYKGSASGLQNPTNQIELRADTGGWSFKNSKPAITDVNNDGYDDLVIFHQGPANEIVRHTLRGSSSGLQPSDPATVSWQFPSQGWLWTNVRVVGGGDFNGDGYGDVLAFSVFPDGKTFNIWSFPGSGSGLGAPVFQRTLGPTAGGWLYDYSKPVITNVNNDSYSDLVIFHKGPNNEIVRHWLKGSAGGIQNSDPSNVVWQYPSQGWFWPNVRLVGGS